MNFLRTRYYSKKKQYLISLLMIIISSVLCFFSVKFIGYGAVALILLMVVSVNAILFDIYPVMLSALLSALIWNFFFIPPTLTFHIGTPEDALMFLMYFVIASINAVLTYTIRQFDKKQREEEEKAKAIELYNIVLNSLSHELKTPIATIIGAIDTIKDNQARLSDKNRADLYAEIETASFRLNRQVENLLNISRLEAGFIQPKKDWCDINELVFKAIRRNRENVLLHTIHFEPNDELPLFYLDGGLLEQILHNVIHNALQHTPEDSTISIEVNQSGEYCKFTISDTGHGFPIDEMDLVFQKFYRLSHKVGGTGLGLSIVKGLVEAMNGVISLENRKEGGARFTISIPAINSPMYAS